jgi:cobalt/nickel transport system permease protein
MSGHDHRHLLFVHGDSRVHRLRPQCKVVAAVLFILAVVATPREAIPAYGAYALALAVVAHHARVPLSFVVRRLVIELPFVAFALFLPFVAGGEQVEVLGMALSSDGLWAAWNVLVKGTLGVATTVILVATTPVGDLLEGLDRLRVPRPLTAVAGFMIRYAEVIGEEARRMRIARESRGYDPRWLWQVRALAASAGSLFLRSYERGERVYLAMVSRGYAGVMPALDARAASRREWVTALALPALGGAIASAAWATRL